MKLWCALVLMVQMLVLAVSMNSQESHSSSNTAELESKLDQALRDIKTLNQAVESMRSELNSLKQSEISELAAGSSGRNEQSSELAKDKDKDKDKDEMADRIIGPDLGKDESDHALAARPEIFLQTRYSVAPVEGSADAFNPNFRISRAEVRWAGKVASRLGAGIEIHIRKRRTACRKVC